MENCIFCKIVESEMPSYTVYENEEFKVIFDRFPSNLGHVLIIPKNHVKNIYEIDPEQAGRLFKLATKLAPILKEEFKLEGLNILQNNEEIAGQTVFHFHLHLIPRYTNDCVNIKWKTVSLKDEEFLFALDKCKEKIDKIKL